MHTHKRRTFIVLSLLACMVSGVSLFDFASITTVSRSEAQRMIELAMGGMAAQSKRVTAASATLSKGEQIKAKAAEKVRVLSHQMRALRTALVKHHRNITVVARRYGIADTSSGALTALLTQAKRDRSILVLKKNSPPSHSPSLRRLLSLSSLSSVRGFHGAASDDASYSVQHWIDLQDRAIADLTVMVRATIESEKLLRERESTAKSLSIAEAELQDGVEIVERSAEEIAEYKRIMAEVDAQVRAMQAELSRIDVRLRAKAERTLLDLGLLSPEDIKNNREVRQAETWRWPVIGRISAGFMDPSYMRIFSVPHKAIDIVIPQGSVVSAAANGVVYLVRDGGKTGYSYVLIGHRDGYATLYGHISQSLVTNGEEVTVGQPIALSGGTPGTHGAGPMTTGAHLHFEVIKYGVNVNPLTVLP